MPPYKLVFVILLAVFSTALAFAEPEHLTVTNGLEISANEFPGVISLVFDMGKGENFFCSGSMIANGVILTAAHCSKLIQSVFHQREAYEMQVAMFGVKSANPYEGIHFYARTGKKRWEINAASVHPDATAVAMRGALNTIKCPDAFKAVEYSFFGEPYCIDWRHDVGLVVSADAIQFPKKRGFPDSFLVPFSEKIPEVQDAVTLVGFGVNDIYQNWFAKIFFSNGAGVKRKGKNVISEMDDELVYLEGLAQDQGSLANPKPNGKRSGIGPGDSGSPLLNSEGKIIAVTSFLQPVDSDFQHVTGSAFVRTDREDIRSYILSSINDIKVYLRKSAPAPQSRQK